MITCGICGAKCISLDSHIQETHLHHLLFAGLLQNSFYHANFPNWSPLFPPPLVSNLHSSTDFSAPSLTNFTPKESHSSPPLSPKRPKLISPHLNLNKPTSLSSSPLHHSFMPLLCNQCSPSPVFKDFEQFHDHLKTHLISSQLSLSNKVSISHCQCPYCNTLITSNLENHIVNCHLGSVSNQYGCKSCNKMFTKPDELQKHLMDIHAHHLYQCAICREMFDSKVTIQVHFAVKHSNECKTFKCNICSEIWSNERDFKIHIKMAHLGNGSFYPHHFSSSINPSSLTTALNLFNNKAYFKCQFCSKEFHIEYLLEKHIEAEHSHQLLSDDSASKTDDENKEVDVEKPVIPIKDEKLKSSSAKSDNQASNDEIFKSTSSPDSELIIKSHPIKCNYQSFQTFKSYYIEAIE